LMQLTAAANLEVMKTLPAARCHALAGKREGQYAVDILENWRLIFSPDHSIIPSREDVRPDLTWITKIKILEITDYH
jgi:plasmid maintenance system killer protein